MSDLAKLIERLEAATGRDRELDIAIYRAEFPHVACHFSQAKRDALDLKEAQHYTSSLDSAMTLVPEGWSAKLYIHAGENSADLYLLGDYSDGDRPSVIGPIEAEACATPALALCIAALKARSLNSPGGA